MTALAAVGLSRRFGDEVAVQKVDLAVVHGQIHAVVGLNGAGKTTLMKMLLGMLRPDTGHALVLDADASSAPGETWRHVGHMIESPFAYPELTVRENLRASGLLQGMTRNDADDAARQMIAQFDLDRWETRAAKMLSLGNKQRLGLAAAVIHAPTVLVLDEPANTLDPAGVVFIRDFLRQRAASGSAILVSSHHFDQLARVADVITVMHRGQIVGSLDPAGTNLEQEFFELVRDWDVKMETRA